MDLIMNWATTFIVTWIDYCNGLLLSPVDPQRLRMVDLQGAKIAQPLDLPTSGQTALAMCPRVYRVQVLFVDISGST